MDTGTIALLISGILGVLRLYEFYWDRSSRLSIKPALTSSPEIGSTILVLNSSKVPANIYYLSLAWVKPSFLGKYFSFFRKIETEDFPTDVDHCNINVPPHSQETLDFSEAHWFDWGTGLKEDIYLKLWVVGSRFPKWFYVIGPNKP